jgi:hypothetical protein
MDVQNSSRINVRRIQLIKASNAITHERCALVPVGALAYPAAPFPLRLGDVLGETREWSDMAPDKIGIVSEYLGKRTNFTDSGKCRISLLGARVDGPDCCFHRACRARPAARSAEEHRARYR